MADPEVQLITACISLGDVRALGELVNIVRIKAVYFPQPPKFLLAVIRLHVMICKAHF